MSTRSAIAIMDDDGKIRSVYAHWDGYLDHNGAILEKHYQDRKKIEALLALGSIILLAERVAPRESETHTFDKPVNGVVVAYHRDRNDVYHAPDVWEDEEDFVKNVERAYWAEFVYLWKGGRWMVYQIPTLDEMYDENRWYAVADAVCVCGV